MIKKISFVALLGFGVALPTLTHAQMQQGYSTDRPDVTVDRSVLEDLKGYQPPPMFGAPETRPEPQPIKKVEIVEPQKEIPKPTAPSLTSPNAEELLKQPIKNHHVLTERNTSMTAPTSADDNLSGPLLPLPGDLIVPKQKQATKTDKKVDKKAVEKQVKKEPIKSVPPAKETKTKSIAIPVIEPVPMPKVKPPVNAYRPKSSQTMPAIPSIKVEKNELAPLSANSPLPVLPPTTDDKTVIEKPSIGLRMMDAALERQMENDPDKIKEQLAETKVKTQPQNKPVQKIPKNTLVFKDGEVTLPKNMEGQIRSNILPDLTKNKTAKIQILSFATSPDKNEDNARRIALSRALEVRDFLKTSKIDISRVDVKALVSDGNSVPPNKIDIVILK